MNLSRLYAASNQFSQWLGRWVLCVFLVSIHPHSFILSFQEKCASSFTRCSCFLSTCERYTSLQYFNWLLTFWVVIIYCRSWDERSFKKDRNLSESADWPQTDNTSEDGEKPSLHLSEYHFCHINITHITNCCKITQLFWVSVFPYCI